MVVQELYLAGNKSRIKALAEYSKEITFGLIYESMTMNSQ